MKPSIEEVVKAHPRLENVTRTLDAWEEAITKEGVPAPDQAVAWKYIFRPEINIASDLDRYEFDTVCSYVVARLNAMGANDDFLMADRLSSIAMDNMPGAAEVWGGRYPNRSQ